ncbi:16S rRNA (guanine(966)-N(2))-methyltransferase RsmD [Stratiformator vulcanicus]|uniref:Ribosomal RNA small subunit methyltransferase D n=1 Tax=Stratiformator vulcanicus TaxID=2527980 RepID=A0A517R6F0_9PLAN|nr:16S rRNA (guanine(966)-N(2))-methyltransferase RsmD [Stratiformator vulcanicus]QDT39440.1 Ribosomal RNA small subunit methyltransferase D [Stratiformator vulcanicus]
MRIIAGRFKRRTLAAVSGSGTRPITDRAKERLFAKLLGHFDGARVLDVFSGTGTLGLEALSRGAVSSVFIEKDRAAFELLQSNIAKLGIEDAAFAWRADAMRCSYRPKGKESYLPYDVIFFDPPFKDAADLAPGGKFLRSLKQLGRDDVSSSDAILIVRLPARREMAASDIWRPDWSLDMGAMSIRVHVKQAASAQESESIDAPLDAQPE